MMFASRFFLWLGYYAVTVCIKDVRCEIFLVHSWNKMVVVSEKDST